jgi:hypothetical protein
MSRPARPLAFIHVVVTTDIQSIGVALDATAI